MNGRPETSDVELHAYVDGALDAECAQAFAARIESDPVLAARVAAYRADMAMLKRVYAPLGGRPIPREWIALAHRPVARPWVSWRMAGAIAAVIVVALAGVLAYRQAQPSRAEGVVQMALDARANTAGAQKIIAVAGNDRQYDAVLSAAVALPVKVPDLRRMGYQLAAIRLYPGFAGAGAAELLYRDGRARLFTLYLRRSGDEARFDQFERDGLRVCLWQDGELSTVMAGNVSTAAMQRLASLAYTGLTI